MVCNEYRELMFERMSGELTPEKEAACVAHEKSCVVCRAELAQFRSMTQKLRAGWPAEEPMPLNVTIPQAAARNWFDVSALWFSRASTGLVAAALLFLIVVRPSVQVGRGGLQMAFGNTAVTTQTATAASTMDEAQLKAMVQAAVAERMSQGVTPAKAVIAAPTQTTQTSPDVQQVAMQVRQLQRTEATLWQQVQQHGLYLDTLWRNTVDSSAVRPASLSR